MKKKIHNLTASIILILFFILIFSCDQATENSSNNNNQTIVTWVEKSGHDMTGDETWSGNIILNGDMKIGTGRTLTIQPGTVIKCVTANLNYDVINSGIVDFYIESGNLVANGTVNKIILFTVNSTTPAAKDWYGITKSGAASKMTLNYCCIKYAKEGLAILPSSSSASAPVITNTMFAKCWFGITNYGIDMSCSNITFTGNTYTGICTYTDTKTTSITNSLFDSNYNGIDIGFSSKDSIVNVSGSNFNANSNYDFYVAGTNNTLNVDNCYNTTKYYGSSIYITNISSSAISGAGCGFDIP
jgi:hypothetical protein